jgi:DNA-binding SARP family transcriptional activator
VLDEILETHAGPMPPTTAASPATREPQEGDAGLAAPAATAAAIAPATGIPGTGADLRILTLGPLCIHLRDQVLDAGAWSYARPRELLVYLAVHPEGKTRDQIGRAIWPHASAAQLKNSFHVTVHHLRRTLGDPAWVVLDGHRYRLAPTLRLHVDASLFEQEARAALRVQEGHDNIGTLTALRALYGGDFLEDEVTGPWCEEERDRLRRLWVDISIRLAGALETAGRHAEAASIYQEVAVKEELNEEAHRGLMRAWARLGERARALRQYERLVVLLRDVLDAEPEPETTSLHQTLRTTSLA